MFFGKKVFFQDFFPKTLFFTTKNIFFGKMFFWKKVFLRNFFSKPYFSRPKIFFLKKMFFGKKVFFKDFFSQNPIFHDQNFLSKNTPIFVFFGISKISFAVFFVIFGFSSKKIKILPTNLLLFSQKKFQLHITNTAKMLDTFWGGWKNALIVPPQKSKLPISPTLS